MSMARYLYGIQKQEDDPEDSGYVMCYAYAWDRQTNAILWRTPETSLRHEDWHGQHNLGQLGRRWLDVNRPDWIMAIAWREFLPALNDATHPDTDRHPPAALTDDGGEA